MIRGTSWARSPLAFNLIRFRRGVSIQKKGIRKEVSRSAGGGRRLVKREEKTRSNYDVESFRGDYRSGTMTTSDLNRI